MNTFRFGRVAFIAGAAALLPACGGSSIPIGAPSSVGAGVRAVKAAKTFHYTGREQTFLVPKGVRQISVVMRGAAGGGTKCYGSYCYPPDDYFGRGGRVHGVIRVRPGEIVYVFVGGQGDDTVGGFNGGGNPGPGRYGRIGSYGGGGASDVRAGNDRLSNRIIVAGGGGGEGSSRDEIGGRGGGEMGESAGVIATAVLLAKVAAQATAAGKITAGRVVLLVRAMSPDNQVLPEPLEMAGAVVVPAAPTAAQLATADMQTAVLAPEVAEGITVVVAVAAVRANTRAYMGARAARAAADHLGPSPALRTSALGEAGKMQRVTD